MSQLAIILVTTFMTIVGVVIATMLERFFIEPLKEFNTIRRQAADAITRHWGLGGAFTNEDGDILHDDPKVLKRAAKEVRSLSAALRAASSAIPCHQFWVKWFGLPSRKAIKSGTGALEQWSYAIFRDYAPTHEYLDKADAALKLYVMWYFDHTGTPDPLERRRRWKRAKEGVH